jgi:hypothetical protein
VKLKTQKDECRSGCEHSGKEVASLCIVDECNKYNVNKYLSISGCVLFNESFINDIKNNLCINQHTTKSCLLSPNCDFFIGFICSKKVSYDGDCSLIGDNTCASTKGCVWKNWCVGCADYDSDEIKEKEDNLNGGWIFGIVSLGFIFILFFYLVVSFLVRFIYYFIIFFNYNFLVLFILMMVLAIVLGAILVKINKKEKE